MSERRCLIPNATPGRQHVGVAKGPPRATLAVSDRYRIAEKRDKSRILSEFVALTGYHPKHAIRILNRPPTSARVRGARKSRVYNEGVERALVVLWEASDRVCGKRLKALLPVLVDSLERHGHLHLDQAVRSLVLAKRCDYQSCTGRASRTATGASESQGEATRTKADPGPHVCGLEGTRSRIHGDRLGRPLWRELERQLCSHAHADRCCLWLRTGGRSAPCSRG